MADPIHEIVARNRAGETAALPSICSAHPDVLRATLLLAEELDRPALIEATSNQVNQFGGYTGINPAAFVTNVRKNAAQTGTNPDRIIFGGDHLGPQVWNNEPAALAMAKARVLVQDYVQAGFTKIHLDCSEPCADDPAALNDEITAERAADLAEHCHANDLAYVIGTEVPPPGGVRAFEESAHVVHPTKPEAARATLATHLQAFEHRGLSGAARQIVGLVVQPGVEFGPSEIDHLPTDATGVDLRSILQDYPGICFEAHSTDYQHPNAYPRLAQMGFAFQKVGPALTFAYRQTMYALDFLIDALDGSARTTPVLRDVLEAEMLRAPGYWQGHYSGGPDTLKTLRHFSYSDRIRYYWPTNTSQAAVAAIHERLSKQALPDPMVEQFFSPNLLERAAQLEQTHPKSQALVLAGIQQALKPYFF